MVPWWDLVAREVQTELVRALRKFKTKQFLSEHKGNAISQLFLVRSKRFENCMSIDGDHCVPFETELKSSILHILG